MKWKKKGQASLIFAIVMFWLVLSLFITFYQNSGFPSITGGSKLNKSLEDLDETEIDETGVGLKEIKGFFGILGALLNPFNVPKFDSAGVTALINIILYGLRFTTLYLIARLIRGGG